MEHYILSKIFLDLYSSKSEKARKIKIKDYDKLETALDDYLVSILGYKIKHNRSTHAKEIKVYLENIIENTTITRKVGVVECIKQYQQTYKVMLENHPLTEQFINSINLLFEKEYNNNFVKRFNNNIEEDINIAVRHINNELKIENYQSSKLVIPTICIKNIDSFELVLNSYINTVKNSDSNYNVFSKKYYDVLKENEKLKMLMQCTIYNATSEDAQDIEMFFNKYINFFSDKTFESLKKINYLCDEFNDKIYVMLKCSEIEDETPYYLSFFLENSRLELPAVKIGIEIQENKKIAHIYSIDFPRAISNKENLLNIEKQIRLNVKNDTYFKYYHPTHLISLSLTLGMLKGIGIEDIRIKQFLPFRHKKILLDETQTEEEAKKIQTKLGNKTMIKYMHLAYLLSGITTLDQTNFSIPEEVESANKLIANLYNEGYKFGQNKI